MDSPESGPPPPPQHDRRKRYRLRRRRYAAAPPAEPRPCCEATPAATDLGPELATARAALDEARAQLVDANDKVLRSRADMDNQRRRFQKEREDLRKFASEEVMTALLPPLEHFSLAMASVATASDVTSVAKGIEMIYRELLGVLQQSGLEPIHPAGAAFDPAAHEAVGTDANAELPDGTVTQVMRPGWSLRGRVLRPAMVKVNRIGE